MTKLHEVLAVEADKQGIADRILNETVSIFKSKHHLFQGSAKILKMDDEGQDSLEASGSEIMEMTTTVPMRLDYTENVLKDWLNVVATKEFTNQGHAKADLTVGDVTLATNVPATYLLGLETKLKKIRSIYEHAPTLANGIIWEPEANGQFEGIFRSRDAEIKSKTKKKVMFQILDKATKEHPAQIEKWNEDVVVGKFTTTSTSGMITSVMKHKFLGKIDELIQATKQARQRANNVDAVLGLTIGEEIFTFIHS